MPTRRKRNEKNDADDIMDFLRSVLRAEPDSEGRTADIKSRLKAAELMAKRYGLLAEKKEASDMELKVIFDYGDTVTDDEDDKG